MTAPLTSEALRLQILNALEPASDGQDLTVIHLLLNRSRRDTSMLPVMGALVTGGYLEKVSTSPEHSPNGPLTASRQRRHGPPSPVRFRLTAAGRLLLQDARHASPPAASLPRPAPEFDPADADSYEREALETVQQDDDQRA